MRSRTGARWLWRRSSGGDIGDQSDSSDRVGARIGPRLYLALLATLSLAACFLPLADHLGYELSELVALAAGLFGGVPGIAAARMERDSSARALSRALWFSLWALAIPVALILLNGVRRPTCDPVGGFALYLALAVPAATLACPLGVACGFLARRGAAVEGGDGPAGGGAGRTPRNRAPRPSFPTREEGRRTGAPGSRRGDRRSGRGAVPGDPAGTADRRLSLPLRRREAHAALRGR